MILPGQIRFLVSLIMHWKLLSFLFRVKRTSEALVVSEKFGFLVRWRHSTGTPLMSNSTS
jgi:hypothetical protein